jgi:hypothetical protein
MWREVIKRKTPKNHFAVNMAANRRFPLYITAASQNSPLNMLRCIKSCRYILQWLVFEIAVSQRQKLRVSPFAYKGTVKQKPPMDKMYYPRPVRSVVKIGLA